jgi:hypothetical protein
MEDRQQRRTSRHHDGDGDGAPSGRSSSPTQGYDGGHGHAEQGDFAASQHPHDVLQLVREAITRTYK